ncbi:MAG: host attachment protein [Gammaproteobacteria bacterium]|nr:host attachment protein [Gammaproteobacteria bacterium]MCW8986593.1 host attachment protein [Gammaproteobacteria bacterium]MCW9029953.1 host attachment protein [Gammaproteobacteria bacterium]
MKPIIIVVADSTIARIFTADSSHSQLNEVETLSHPEGRMHEQDMVSDMPGKGASKSGAGGHVYDEKIEPKQQEMIEFAKRIADYLDDTRKENKLGKLMLIAAPKFLGELRNHLSAETSEKVSFELDKNLAQHSVEDIRKHLP